MKETGKKFPYSVGTMIEVPRGALTADEIAETAEFFSFGTNDLTQTCLGMSRDDSGSFLPAYQAAEIIKQNPFASIDTGGVGQLMKIGVPQARIHQRVEQLHEFNPMLGFRGCRLGIGYPEISAMQARAVFEAAAQVQKEGIKVRPEVMIPLVGFKKELDLQIEVVHQAARDVEKEQKVKLNYMVGTMIEIPRGALTADEIAQSAEFFSFGTNDLTQTGLGMSRDDSGSFLPHYQELEIVKKNPFATIDATGVGQLVDMAVKKGRATRPNLKLGICGEHGGDPASIHFFEKVGLDYVSASPYRIPVARLAAAQAALSVKVGD
jgi:pyruvate,orthophosphate dikinase